MKPVKITGLNELADAFLDLTIKEQSAYIMVIRGAGPFVRIGVLEGQVTYLKCGAAQGSEVLPLLRDIQPGDHFLLYPPRPDAISPELPDSEHVLAALAGGGSRPGNTPSPQGQAKSTSAHSGISREQVFQAVCPVFRQHIGPMTDILCDEAMEAMPQVLSQEASLQLVKDLARNLRDPKKSLEFTAAAKGRVKAMFR